MKRLILPALLCLFPLASLSFAASVTDIERHPSCKYCGMDRGKYAHNRMLIEYDDGTSSGACSLHCSAVDLANNIDKLPKETIAPTSWLMPKRPSGLLAAINRES